MSYTKLTDFAAKDALLSGNPSKLLRGTEIGAEFDAIESAMAAAEAVNITAPIIAASTSKTTPVDADVLPILDSAAANILKKVTWVNIKATLKTYFDTLYAAAGAFAASGANADITSLTALTAGGLPNNSVLTADIADSQITSAKIAANTIQAGDMAGGAGSGNLTQYTTATTPLATAGASFSGSHSLGSVPSESVLELTCLSAEYGYSVGDVVQVYQTWNGSVITGFSMWKNTTSVGLFVAMGLAACICNKTTGAALTPTAANWSYRFRLRAA